MPRPRKGPRLEINDRGMYIVRDTGNVNRGTGCYVRDGKKAEAAAQAKLAEYILSKRDPAKAIDKDNPNAAKIADVMALEMRYFSNSKMLDSRKREFISSCERIGRWFGKHAVGDLNGDLQECYARERRRYVMKIVNGERTAVVVMSDGDDNKSFVPFPAILEAIIAGHPVHPGGVVDLTALKLPISWAAQEALLSRNGQLSLRSMTCSALHTPESRCERPSGRKCLAAIG